MPEETERSELNRARSLLDKPEQKSETICRPAATAPISPLLKGQRLLTPARSRDGCRDRMIRSKNTDVRRQGRRRSPPAKKGARHDEEDAAQ